MFSREDAPGEFDARWALMGALLLESRHDISMALRHGLACRCPTCLKFWALFGPDDRGGYGAFLREEIELWRIMHMIERTESEKADLRRALRLITAVKGAVESSDADAYLAENGWDTDAVAEVGQAVLSIVRGEDDNV